MSELMESQTGYAELHTISNFSFLRGASHPEELVARNFIIDKRPDVVINVVDASNLERNLYLAIQLRELGVDFAQGQALGAPARLEEKAAAN